MRNLPRRLTLQHLLTHPPVHTPQEGKKSHLRYQPPPNPPRRHTERFGTISTPPLSNSIHPSIHPFHNENRLLPTNTQYTKGGRFFFISSHFISFLFIFLGTRTPDLSSIQPIYLSILSIERQLLTLLYLGDFTSAYDYDHGGYFFFIPQKGSGGQQSVMVERERERVVAQAASGAVFFVVA